MTARTNRRVFLGTGALTAAGYRRVLGANDRIGVGFIGYGLIGKRHVQDFQKEPNAELRALAETHRGRLTEGQAALGPNCQAFSDFRKLLDLKSIQAVVVSTPDHWHALMTMLACAAGKDVYVEKPLSLFVREGRWMIQVAARTNRIVQVGTQQRSGRHYQRARQLIREGHLGTITTIRMNSYRNVMPGFGSPPDSEPPPELDWNQFLGPAPLRPYNPSRGIYHFRWFWDTSGGQMTNLGHHSLDILRWVMEADPAIVMSTGGRFALTGNGETPDTQDVLFQFPGRTDHGFTACWSLRETCQGGGSTSGIEFCGTKGSLSITRRGFQITGDPKVPPESRIPTFTGQPSGGPPVPPRPASAPLWTPNLTDSSGSEDEQFGGHVRNFLDCIRTRKTPASDLESSHRVSTMCHLANLSLKLGRSLRWDAVNERVTNDAEANTHLIRPYRSPWDRELTALGLSTR